MKLDLNRYLGISASHLSDEATFFLSTATHFQANLNWDMAYVHLPFYLIQGEAFVNLREPMKITLMPFGRAICHLPQSDQVQETLRLLLSKRFARLTFAREKRKLIRVERGKNDVFYVNFQKLPEEIKLGYLQHVRRFQASAQGQFEIFSNEVLKMDYEYFLELEKQKSPPRKT